ncbi:MAG: AAA family ATPase [Thioalkalivibrio sp.]|nr:AAA family ATPase [Thioalkalivibrio sp.]
MSAPDIHARTRDGVRTLDLRTVLAFLRRGGLVAVVMALLAGGTAYFTASLSDPVYRASIVLVASSPGGSFGAIDVVSPPRVDPTVYRSALLEGTVVADALTEVNGRRPTGLEVDRFVERMSVTIEDQEVSSIIRVDVQDKDATYAATIANAVAEQLMDWDRDRARRNLTRGVAGIEQALAEIVAELATTTDAERRATLEVLREERQADLELARATSASAVVVGLLEPLRLASPPEQAIGPRVVFSTFVATVLGLVAGYALIFIRMALDTRVTDRNAVMALTGLPVLAEFARRTRRNVRLSGEMANFFRTKLQLASPEARPLVVVIASAMDAAEKDGVAVNLAVSFARGGQRALLVDADLRNPGATASLDVVPNQVVTLESRLRDPESKAGNLTVAAGSNATFDLIPSFTTARFPVDLLNQGLPGLLGEWGSEYDVIIVDAPPVIPFADTLAIASLSTGVVLCVSAAQSTRDQLLEAMATLERVHVSMLGVVLTNLTPKRINNKMSNNKKPNNKMPGSSA